MDSAKIQGTLVEIRGIGVLIRGPSGSGKSETALRLMDRGHRLVSDDLVEVVRGPDGRIAGRRLEDTVRIEIRGVGVFDARNLFEDGTAHGATLDLVVDLERYDPGRDAGRLSPHVEAVSILGCELPGIRVPLTSSADPALVIEMLVRSLAAAGKLGTT